MLAAIVASMCCITPVFSLLAGLSGIAATFSWMEPFRPYLITITVGILGFAWYQKVKPNTKEEIQCACEEDEKPSFWQSRNFLSLVTAFAALMLAFPSYSHIFYPSTNHQTPSSYLPQDTAKIDKIVLTVKGMTCAGCESHIQHEVAKMIGVKSVQASYANGTTTVEYFRSKLEYDDVVSAINKTGYLVIEDHQKNTEFIHRDGY